MDAARFRSQVLSARLLSANHLRVTSTLHTDQVLASSALDRANNDLVAFLTEEIRIQSVRALQALLQDGLSLLDTIEYALA